ncbi:hypothetical protein TYRP_010691 [Tyrophagus putrescentiae]|nr:hypothetical protein TYRP_010691 [Tyrophagus putrescentiae]
MWLSSSAASAAVEAVRLPQTKKVRLKKSSRRHEMPMEVRWKAKRKDIARRRHMLRSDAFH